MYASSLSTNEWLQGDILNDLPLIAIPDPITTALTQTLFNVQSRTMMLLNQSCDVNNPTNRNFLIFAPVFTVQELHNTGIKIDMEQMADQKYGYWFYLPAEDPFPESYADLTRILSLPRSILDKNKRVKSLSDIGRHWLGHKLSLYFGRPFSPYQNPYKKQKSA